MVTGLVDAYHRTLAGRVTSIELTHAEAALAIGTAPHEWALGLRQFAPWPLDRVRGKEVIPPSLADEARPIANSIWDRT